MNGLRSTMAFVMAVSAVAASPGFRETALAEGATAPKFELAAAGGGRFSLEDALERGPVAVVFYRGHW